MIWDADKLRKIIDNRSANEEAAQGRDEITYLEVTPEKPEKRYFKVILVGIRNEELLNLCR